MARTGFIHHVGTFFLLVATVLLIITDISAPVVSNISILKVEVGTNRGTDLFSDNDRFPTITFGTFGYCIKNPQNSDRDFCPDSRIGYDPVGVIEQAIGGDGDTGFTDYAHDTARALTKVMVLHPVATGLAFVSFLLSLGAGFVGSFVAALGALVTFVVVLVVIITDFVSFAIVRSAVNDARVAADASWGPAIWTTLVAGILCLLAAVILLFTCCSARLHRRREPHYRSSKEVPVASPTRRRRRWF